MRPKAKINWDTVELVGPLSPASAPADPPVERELRPYPEKRGRSIVKQILSGAAAKARSRGAIYTHTQLRVFIPAGLEMLIYSWCLVAAAVESDRDISRGVEAGARAIIEASHRLSVSGRRGA
jgi:hypothetical protein